MKMRHSESQGEDQRRFKELSFVSTGEAALGLCFECNLLFLMKAWGEKTQSPIVLQFHKSNSDILEKFREICEPEILEDSLIIIEIIISHSGHCILLSAQS